MDLAPQGGGSHDAIDGGAFGWLALDRGRARRAGRRRQALVLERPVRSRPRSGNRWRPSTFDSVAAPSGIDRRARFL